MLGLGQAVIDIVLRTGELESMGAEGLAGLQGELDVGDRRALVGVLAGGASIAVENKASDTYQRRLLWP
jgi:hypothetical protein